MWFHTHTFDSSKWKLEIEEELFKTEELDVLWVMGFPKTSRVRTGTLKVYSNTCLKCGTLVFKKVRTDD